MVNSSDNAELSLGQKVKIHYKIRGERKTYSIRGKIIYKNDFFITLKTKNYNTSLDLFDFQCGMAALVRG